MAIHQDIFRHKFMLYFFIICLISLMARVVYIMEVRSSSVAVFIIGILNFSLSFRQILEQNKPRSLPYKGRSISQTVILRLIRGEHESSSQENSCGYSAGKALDFFSKCFTFRLSILFHQCSLTIQIPPTPYNLIQGQCHYIYTFLASFHILYNSASTHLCRQHRSKIYNLADETPSLNKLESEDQR